jgi:hypothetical protein
MDARPPDTEGLGYIGNACRQGRHEECEGYWPADPEITGKWGHGSRCACPCHLAPADGDEPDRAAEYERMRRKPLEGAPGGEAIEQP